MQQKLAFERHLEEKHKEHTQLLLMNTSRKEHMLNSVRQVNNISFLFFLFLKFYFLLGHRFLEFIANYCLLFYTDIAQFDAVKPQLANS